MVGASFLFHNKGMDILKLFEKVMEDDDVKGIPLMYVFTIVCSVVEAISTGDCFYNDDFD